MLQRYRHILQPVILEYECRIILELNKVKEDL